MSIRLVVMFLVAAILPAGSSFARAQSTTDTPVTAQQDANGPAGLGPGTSPDSARPVAPLSASAPQAQSVTVPAGTAIPLTLVSPIKSRSTKRGDTVRAMVAFPVTTGTQLAIPAGTYVEGTVTRLVPNTLKNKMPEVEIHFTRMVFTNGYAVHLDASSTQARLDDPVKKAPVRESARSETKAAEEPARSFSFAGQFPTQPPPTLPPMNHPNIGLIAGVTMGAAAAVGIGTLVWMRHRATHTDYVLFDSGWQFQMVLTAPLSLQVAQVNAAASTPRAQ
jgi:hypothetical protein